MTHLLLIIIYLSFISLGLPDALLGSAWPNIYVELETSVSYAGIIFMIISAGTVVSSLMSDKLTRTLGTGKVTALSVGMTAIALFGFSMSNSFFMLCLWAIPYGLGAGSVDASLNNYVALHYASRHMSWLHCMWGVGASVGPYIMGYILASGGHWTSGYRVIGLLQVVLTAILLLSIPLWTKQNTQIEKKQLEHKDSQKEKSLNQKEYTKEKRNLISNRDYEEKHYAQEQNKTQDNTLSLGQIIKIAGVKEIMITFFCYCALEQTAGLWASSYLVLHKGIDSETATFFASIFFIGITIGRALNGFLTMKLNDTQLIRLGQGIVAVGIFAMLLPMGEMVSLAGLILIGLGCAPIYPCVIHSTPENFGADKSQVIIGVQMASAYMGNIVMPPLFGVIADSISITLFPIYLLGILVLMFFMHKKMIKECNRL
ncbi:MAG: MFS transporter [Lachnospiraceae bacterium]|nr:MFS transporter [Lachnospiraceae bacterium]